MAGLRTSAVALLCLYWHYMHVKAGTLFAVPGDDVLFNISIAIAPVDNSFIALERSQDERHKIMVFLDRINPPEIAGAYRARIKYTGNIGRGEVTFRLYNVTLEDAGEFRVVPVGIRKVYGSQILAVAGQPDNPTIIERTIPQVNKDHVLECKTQSNSRPETNGFKMSFIWKRNDSVLANNSIQTVQEETLSIHRLQREDRFDKYTCIAFDSEKLKSNKSNYHQIDPKYGPSKELTLDPSNRTYFVEEGFEMRNIICSADCHPDCIYTWDNGVRQGKVLALGVIDDNKRGIYRCTAYNPITNVSLTTSIEVILTSRNNCSCLLGTCQVDMCSSSTITPAHSAKSGLCTDEPCPNEHNEPKTEGKKEFPVAVVSAVGGATFACMNLAIVLVCCKYNRNRLLKSSTTASIPLDDNVNFSPREGQESEEVLDDEDTYSTIDDVFSTERAPSAEMTLKSESFRKKRTSVRYTRQPSVSSRRTSSTADSGIEEEIETP
ncbi:hypothetical protein CHS0354_001037 [Potamilus streckersoni]|uniref:Ig-like domain-containing protein n=1 Tax=Potamilus streckersoni TaxID=2493646 RepID=A0AAE0W2B4_9BIVA|nr:hypothetical protein CHS0354_001037 [Potamilus streckersoni]